MDYSKSVKGGYHFAQFTAYAVGSVVGKFIDSLKTDNSKIHIIGYDLGAHIAAFGSRTSSRGIVGKITGLDPLAFGITFNDPKCRLNATDAKRVEVLHTNSGMFGLGSPLGTIDYYVGNGVTQTGCTSK